MVTIKINYDSNTPIFNQIAEAIEEDILAGVYKENEAIISSTQLSKLLKVNPTTSVRAVSVLNDQGIVYKKRGIGMFVAEGAVQKIRDKRLKKFKEILAVDFLDEAVRLGLSLEDVIDILKGGGEIEG